jgi:hypothetical protein
MTLRAWIIELRGRVRERLLSSEYDGVLKAERIDRLCEQLQKAEAERDEEQSRTLALELQLDEARAELARLTTLRPMDEWHDDDGDVLWWRVPIEEAPYASSPLDDSWTGSYYTHWTPIPPANEAAPKC